MKEILSLNPVPYRECVSGIRLDAPEMQQQQKNKMRAKMVYCSGSQSPTQTLGSLSLQGGGGQQHDCHSCAASRQVRGLFTYLGITMALLTVWGA